MTDIDEIAARLELCVRTWEPDARLIGNVTAGEIGRVLQRVRELEAELTRLRRIEAAVWSAPVFVDGGDEAESLRKKYARELDRRTDQERMHWELGYDTAIIDLRKGIFP